MKPGASGRSQTISVRPLGSTFTVVRFSKLARSCAFAAQHKASPSSTVDAIILRTRTELPPSKNDYCQKSNYTEVESMTSGSTNRIAEQTRRYRKKFRHTLTADVLGNCQRESIKVDCSWPVLFGAGSSSVLNDRGGTIIQSIYKLPYLQWY